MHSRTVEIKSPCHESWDAMHGDDARRFCDVCAKHVHNLSAMTKQEAADLLTGHKGQHLCVRYSSSEDGKIKFRDAAPGMVPVSRLRAARTAFAAMLLAACAPHGDGPPIQDLGDVAIEAMARDAKPSPEGGCDVQTGPFTTMHFPPGHAVCRDVADLGHAIQVRPPGETPVDNGRKMPLMGEMSPDPVPEMGQAMPAKEPCDPPPSQIGEKPTTPKTLPVMGDIEPDFEPQPPEMGAAVPVEVPYDPPPSQTGEKPAGDTPELDAPPPPPPPPKATPVKMGKVAPAKTGGAIVGEF